MPLKECSICGKEYERKNLKKIGSIFYCSSCYIKKRKEHREFLKRDILGIRKRNDLEKEWKEKRESQPLIIKGSKVKKVSAQFHPYLTKDEKKFLYKKYFTQGLNSITIKNKINKISNHIKSSICTWKQENIENKNINEKFKEEYLKLVMNDQR